MDNNYEEESASYQGAIEQLLETVSEHINERQKTNDWIRLKQRLMIHKLNSFPKIELGWICCQISG